MGLDMCLSARKSVSSWEHGGTERAAECERVLDAVGLSGFELPKWSPCVEIEVSVAYWRKANAIHKWFVDNCQDGRDECQSSYVSREQLQELLGLCKQVLDSVETLDGEVPNGTTYHGDGRVEHHTVPGRVVMQAGIAEKLLPAKDGCFFGNTGYNEWYLRDLEGTVKMLEAILGDKRLEGWSFAYAASW